MVAPPAGGARAALQLPGGGSIMFNRAAARLRSPRPRGNNNEPRTRGGR